MGDMKMKMDLLIMVQEYLEAVTNNDASNLPLSPDVRVTENGVDIQPGTGVIWGEPRRIPCRQTFVDPENDMAAFFGVITNTTSRHTGAKAQWWLTVIRLKLSDGRITEIEEIVRDDIFAHYEKHPWEITADPFFEIVLPAREQQTRCELIQIVEKYWDAVARDLSGQQVPFHPDAIRSECGTITTDGKNFPNSARGDFTKTGHEGWQWQVVNRRYPIVDVSRGLVVAFADLKTTEQTDQLFLPCIVAEVFRIECGLIKRLSAIFYVGDNSSQW